MKRRHVSLEYDPEADAAYILLRRGKVAESEEVQPGLILDFDANDNVVGVEILRFSRRFKPKAPPATAPARRGKAHSLAS